MRQPFIYSNHENKLSVVFAEAGEEVSPPHLDFLTTALKTHKRFANLNAARLIQKLQQGDAILLTLSDLTAQALIEADQWRNENAVLIVLAHGEHAEEAPKGNFELIKKRSVILETVEIFAKLFMNATSILFYGDPAWSDPRWNLEKSGFQVVEHMFRKVIKVEPPMQPKEKQEDNVIQLQEQTEDSTPASG